MYDYREAMTEDVKQWITDEVNLADWTEDRGGLEQGLLCRVAKHTVGFSL